MFPLIGVLERWLEKRLPERLPAVDRPRYLSDASAEFPDTAIEAVRNETLRVYEAATRIIAAGLGIDRRAITPAAPPDPASASTAVRRSLPSRCSAPVHRRSPPSRRARASNSTPASTPWQKTNRRAALR